ncbi:MAG: hypothetical protein BMS9Abin37_1286 [Acidobacteriota bacterium]|nr:MAG: hypothetical protein BMS9Abin37_1286 [Acidobacteriota bacterium]
MQGTLSPDSLLATFRELQARAASGILYVNDSDSAKRVSFKNGRIVAADSSDAKDQLGETLVRRHKLTASELHRARVAAKHAGKTLSTVLGELDILSAAALELEMSRLSRTIVDALFRLHRGEYRFEETASEKLLGGTLDLAPAAIAEEALARAESKLHGQLRWSKDAEGGHPYAESTLSTKHSALVDLLTEQFRSGLTMADVLEMSTLSREDTLDGLEALIAAGILNVSTNQELQSDTEPDPNRDAPAPRFHSAAPPTKLGRFEVQRVLGRGSMGAVLLAQDPAIDRIVAIKLIQTAVHLPQSSQEKYKERFYREASAAGQLTHPNIVTVFDVGHADDDTPFIVMEFVEGKTLSEILETETLSFARAFQIAHDVLEGLAFAHSQGIVHRDIKPGNIMVTPDFRGKIMDFGIAHVVGSELTSDDDVLGSPYYMAPEQLSKGTIDRRTDLFSFAVVLYRMLTGALPFVGDSFAAIAQSILNDEPIPPDQKNRSVTVALRNVILRCLEKNADDRYDNAEDVSAALESARKGQEESSGTAVTKRVRRTVEAHRDRWLPISVALILGALLVFGLALTSERQSSAVDSSPSLFESGPKPPTEAPDAAQPDGPSENTTTDMPPPTQEPVPAITAEPPPPKPRPTPAPTTVPPPKPKTLEAPTIADLFYEARMALERGELDESRLWLEELLLKDPTFEGASELLIEVTDRMWEETLPLTFAARHKHRLGSCRGELNLTTLGVRYVSEGHDWAWSHEEIRVLERPDDATLYVETFEKDVIGLGKNKRYKFELDGSLSEADWVRYERLAR